MRVLGIDPGSSITGYGIVDYNSPIPPFNKGGGGGGLSAITWGAIKTSSRHSFPQRLKIIHDSLVEIIKRYSPDVAVIENLFFAENAKSALKLGQARGAAILAAANLSIEVTEYTPLEIKQAVTGYGRADKGQIQDMVAVLLNLDESPQPLDASDALAIAICHIHTSAFKLKTLAK
ncbi:MAG: crossover junction endodeoxyribonuclease RuvC [Nitrospinae bacterium]|nr:crossover junction endodeoxyribonuclease RuvC [Nitrospinota bacterium]MBI3814884.1 crossover junction endodeoxyribonuclease RuvC [Nitrospinota bacterium]